VTARFRTKLALANALVWMFVTAAPLTALAAMSRETAETVRTALNRGRADDTLRLLDTALQQDKGDAEALNLRCRVFFAEERWDEAIGACEQSTQLAPGNSSYHMWLGRAYGEKADRVIFVTAYKMAKRIHAEFEMAASLDGRNGEALSDLGEYYVEAPAILGGGEDKAEGVARQLDGFAPERAHALRAWIAEHRKDYPAAEKEFRAAIAASHEPAQAWMELGSYYSRRERLDAMRAVLESGAAADREHGPALADGASTLMKTGQEPQLAIAWMRSYLASDALSEEAPAFVVHARLGSLLKQQGDGQGAQREFAAARTLAKDFEIKQAAKTNTGR
jgi:tetratricopeptide (TPR) repeat protein